jgi:hypothetical protein
VTKQIGHAPPAPLNADALRAELAAAGVPIMEPAGDGAGIVLGYPDGKTPQLTVTVADDADPATVAQVIAAHAGQPTPAQQAAAQLDADVTNALPQLVQLVQKARQVRDGSAQFTPAELQQIAARVVLALARLLSR